MFELLISLKDKPLLKTSSNLYALTGYCRDGLKIKFKLQNYEAITSPGTNTLIEQASLVNMQAFEPDMHWNQL